MTRVDLNCDMGESYGAFTIGNDAAVFPFITSANIACGFHGGDPGVMRRTVLAAVQYGVAIGAHPGLPDLIGFGRREMAVTAQDVYDMVVYQVGALRAVATAASTQLRHVKPHGALYNMAAAQPVLATAIAHAIRDTDPALRLVGRAGSALIAAGRAASLITASEVFADRHYQADGALVSRSLDNAVIASVDEAVQRAIEMVRHHRVTAIDGTTIAIQADTLCVHGDAPHAPALVRELRSALASAGVDVRPLDADTAA